MANLKIHDVQVGMFITVVSNLRNRDDKSHQGDVLEVKAIDPPHLCVEEDVLGRTNINLDFYSIRELSAEYVKAMLEENTSEEPDESA